MRKTHVFLAVVLFSAFFYAYAWQHLYRDQLYVPLEGYELEVVSGASLKQICNNLHAQQIISHPRLLRWYASLRGYANKIQAGEYIIEPGMTPIHLIELMRVGSVTQHSFTIIEGQRTRDIIKNLQSHPKIVATLNGLSDAQIIEALNLPIVNLEGIFWPETYYFPAKSKDVDFLRRAYLNMQTRLQDLWLERDPKIKLATPYEALILASIIEKESGVADEYAQISGVYHLRLAKKMRLQADPTVIYGLELSGQLYRSHLQIDSPYNTYLNVGLPPTPIAIPSMKAIHAALHPADGNSLYFVAKGNGAHVFSSTLAEHNKAVKQYLKNNK